jgi:hypothetical protein
MQLCIHIPNWSQEKDDLMSNEITITSALVDKIKAISPYHNFAPYINYTKIYKIDRGYTHLLHALHWKCLKHAVVPGLAFN